MKHLKTKSITVDEYLNTQRKELFNQMDMSRPEVATRLEDILYSFDSLLDKKDKAALLVASNLLRALHRFPDEKEENSSARRQ